MERGKRGGEEVGKEVIGKVQRIEKMLEEKEREERRRYIVVRGVKVEEGKVREGVESIMKEIGARVEIVSARRMRGGGGEIVAARLGSMENKREVMERKRALKGRAVRIADDWTWKERRMQWKLKEIAAKEERNGRRVWVSYGRIRIDE